MDAKVISAFTDRLTKEVFIPGDTYAGDEARIAELAAGGYVEEPKKPAPKRAVKKKTE